MCSRDYPEGRTHCPEDGVSRVALRTGASERPEDLVGQIVDGRYRVERIVGKGGMGTVYACRHVVVGKEAALLPAQFEAIEGKYVTHPVLLLRKV